MLRKRSRTVQKQSRSQVMPDPASDSCFSSDAALAPKARGGSSFFTVPGIFVGFCVKGSSECDSARSPTSPLEFRAFPNLGRSPGGGHSPRSWDCSRVGLGIVDSFNDEIKPCEKVLGLSGRKNILFGSQMRINTPSPKTHLDDTLRDDDPLGVGPKSLPKDYCTFSQSHIESPKSALGLGSSGLDFGELGKIRSCSAIGGASSLPLSRLIYRNLKTNSEILSSDTKDSSQLGSPLARGGDNFDEFPGSLPIPIGSPHGFMDFLSASEIELSEDYTCIISHGPNPKTTRIFGDYILESHSFPSPDRENMNGVVGEGSPPHPSHDFLSFCFSCKKKLDEGKDIYIYRGERAFCSCDCRDREILVEEQMEKPAADCSDSIYSSIEEEIFL